MTDHERELLKWVAEELLGLPQTILGQSVYYECECFRGLVELNHFESWHGIGLVVDEIKTKPTQVWFDFSAEVNPKPQWYWQRKPWFTVYEAARKAVEGKEEPPNACPGHP